MPFVPFGVFLQYYDNPLSFIASFIATSIFVFVIIKLDFAWLASLSRDFIADKSCSNCFLSLVFHCALINI